MKKIVITLVAMLVVCAATGAHADEPPSDFPHFDVPGQENEMKLLRELYWLHYPGAGPKSTMWDEWLSGPSLWPAVESTGTAEQMRREWRAALESRHIDAEGYVATHQHASIAHQQGWPFPSWNQGEGGYGWHFSFLDGPPQGWRPNDLNNTDGWEIFGAQSDGIQEDGWHLGLNDPGAVLIAPEITRDPFRGIQARQAPFLQLRWKARGLGAGRPYIEWLTDEDLTAGRDFMPTQRVYIDPIDTDALVYTMIPMYKQPAWTGVIKRLRICFDNPAGARVVVHSFFSQYDTRHNINAQAYIRGCAKYFWWTGDVDFLRAQMPRMRTALRFVMTEHKTIEKNVIDMSAWWGHEGRTGLARNPDGTKRLLAGEGIGNNYWDLLPFGGLDCYATIQYYDAVRTMEKLERAVRRRLDWDIPAGTDMFEPDWLAAHAAKVKETGNNMFWVGATGRFAACVDANGVQHDYGFTFLNLEAIAYDFATDEHATSIMSWINGDRIVAGDTAQGADIYHWRFAPRATTRRNTEWYGWFWTSPESIPWGGQVQDGGAVLGFSYHDLLARLKVLGPDNAWTRLKEILAWFQEVQAAGGYRKYYDGSREGSLQGCGTPGGLGLDCEFFESVMVPEIMIEGFLGFDPAAENLRPVPRFPQAWQSLRIDRIYWHGQIMELSASR